MGKPLIIPDLVLRAIKGAALTSTELDSNFTVVQNFCQSLSNIIAASLNSDGTLAASTIATAALADRSVSASKIGLDALPVFVDTGLSNAYSISPSPAITAYTQPMTFFVYPQNTNTGAATLAVNGLAATPILKATGAQLDAGDISQGQMFMVSYIYGTNGYAFRLLGGGSSSKTQSTATTSYSGISQLAPAVAAIASSVSFSHSFGTAPTTVQAWLVCLTSELGYNIGDQVPILSALDANGASGVPYFQLSANSTNVTVQKVSAGSSIYVPNSSSAITQANWGIKIYAEFVYPSIPLLFPATGVLARGSNCGAISYGTKLFFDQTASVGAASGNQLFQVLNLANANMSPLGAIGPIASGSIYTSYGMRTIRKSALLGGGDGIWLVSNAGIHYFDPNSSTASLIQVASAAGMTNAGLNALCAVVYVDTSANPPITYVVPSGWNNTNGSALYSIPCYKFLGGSAGAAWQANGTWSTNNTNGINLHNATIVNVAAFNKVVSGTSTTPVVFSNILFFQFNQLNGRIYVIESSSLMLHIFQLIAAAVTPSSIAYSGGVATVTSTAHGLSTGQKIFMAGANQALFNGTFIITVTGANTFTYAMSADPGVASATGAFAYQVPQLNFPAWWNQADGTRYAQMTYVKSLAIAMSHPDSVPYKTKFVVEHDTVTGAEKALVMSQQNSSTTNFFTNIHRQPWIE